MSIEESKTIYSDRETETNDFLGQAKTYFDQKKYDDAVKELFNIDHLFQVSSTEESSIKTPAIEGYNSKILLYWSKRAKIYYEYLKRYEEAARCYKKCLRCLQRDPLVHKALGDCSRKLQKFEEAHEFYEKALDWAPMSGLSSDHVASIYHHKGLTFEKQGELGKAQDSYKTAIEKDPNNHLYLSHYGNMLIANNDPKKGLEYLTKAEVLLKTGNSSKVLSKANILYSERILSQIIAIEEQLEMIEKAMEEAPGNKKRQEGFQEAINQKNMVRKLIRQRTKETLEEIETSPNIDNLIQELYNQNQQLKKMLQEVIQSVKEQGVEVKEQKSDVHNVHQESFFKLTDYEKVVNSLIEAKNDEEKNKLKDYFNAFVGTISSVYITSQLIDSNIVPLNKRTFHGQLLSTVVSLIPFYGNTASQVISNLDELNEKKKLVKAARKMKQLASSETYLSQKVSKVVCEILQNLPSEKKILSVNNDYFEKNPNGLWQKGLAFIEGLGKSVEKSLYGELYAAPAAKLGHEDANFLIKELLDPRKTAEFTITTSMIIITRHENSVSTSQIPSDPVNNSMQSSKTDKKSWLPAFFTSKSPKTKI